MDGAKRKGKHGKKHGKRGAKKARGRSVTFRGKLYGIGKRGRKVTFKANRAAFGDVADFMDGARGRAAARRARKPKHAGRKAGRKARKGTRKRKKLPTMAACVKRVIAHNKRLGTHLRVPEAAKMCSQMLKAGKEAKAAVAKVPGPAVGGYEEYQRRCRGEFKRVLGGQIERIEDKFCRAGYTRSQVRGSLEAVAKQLAAI